MAENCALEVKQQSTNIQRRNEKKNMLIFPFIYKHHIGWFEELHPLQLQKITSWFEEFCPFYIQRSLIRRVVSPSFTKKNFLKSFVPFIYKDLFVCLQISHKLDFLEGSLPLHLQRLFLKGNYPLKIEKGKVSTI